MSQETARQRPARPRDTIAFTRKTFQGARAVGSFLPALTSKALQKYGFSAASLITDWPAIVGRELAAYAAPERIRWPRAAEHCDEDTDARASAKRSGAVLVLRVEAARALDVQYRSQQIIERINAYFGYAAVAQLRLVQAPLSAFSQQRQRRTQPEPLTREVTGIADAGLRDALARLGAEIRTGK